MQAVIPTRTVAVLLFDDVELLEFTAPFEVFSVGENDPARRIAEIYLGRRMLPKPPNIVALIETAVVQRGIDSAARLYRWVGSRYAATEFDEQQLNGIGYDLIRKENL